MIPEVSFGDICRAYAGFFEAARTGPKLGHIFRMRLDRIQFQACKVVMPQLSPSGWEARVKQPVVPHARAATALPPASVQNAILIGECAPNIGSSRMRLDGSAVLI